MTRYEERKAGIGWVIEDLHGSVLKQESIGYENVNSPVAAEGIALHHAMKTAMSNRWKRVCFRSDSQILLKTIKSGKGHKDLYGIAHDIEQMINSFEAISFMYIPRECNVVADTLAKNALCTNVVMVP